LSTDRAIVNFPGITPQSDVDKFVSDNHLTIVGWLPQPMAQNRAGERSAIVALPPIQLQVIDAVNGIFGATVPAHLDASRLNEWAQSSGLELVSYDAESGALRVHKPVPVAPAAVTYQPAKKAVKAAPKPVAKPSITATIS